MQHKNAQNVFIIPKPILPTVAVLALKNWGCNAPKPFGSSKLPSSAGFTTVQVVHLNRGL